MDNTSKVISRVFMVRCNGVVIDGEDNAHSSLELAMKYYDGLFRFLYNEYDIIEIERVHTIYKIKED